VRVVGLRQVDGMALGKALGGLAVRIIKARSEAESRSRRAEGFAPGASEGFLLSLLQTGGSFVSATAKQVMRDYSSCTRGRLDVTVSEDQDRGGRRRRGLV